MTHLQTGIPARAAGLQPGCLLAGGPMDGWYVTPDAPALAEDWYSTMPSHLQARWTPGRYVRTGPDGVGIERAEWREEG